MTSLPKFGLLGLLRADLLRQWTLAHGSNVHSPSVLRLVLIIVSPRFQPVLLCRLAYQCDRLGLSPIAKAFSFLNFLLFGIEIATRCPIGPGLFLPHTQGTVIGALSIGANATIYQGVTLGAKEVDFHYSEASRPIIGDGVIIGSGAKVLGGVTIGDRVRIGANAVVNRSAKADTLLVGVPAKQIDIGQPDETT